MPNILRCSCWSIDSSRGECLERTRESNGPAQIARLIEDMDRGVTLTRERLLGGLLVDAGMVRGSGSAIEIDIPLGRITLGHP